MSGSAGGIRDDTATAPVDSATPGAPAAKTAGVGFFGAIAGAIATALPLTIAQLSSADWFRVAILVCAAATLLTGLGLALMGSFAAVFRTAADGPRIRQADPAALAVASGVALVGIAALLLGLIALQIAP
jgi:hypothetical protein